MLQLLSPSVHHELHIFTFPYAFFLLHCILAYFYVIIQIVIILGCSPPRHLESMCRIFLNEPVVGQLFLLALIAFWTKMEHQNWSPSEAQMTSIVLPTIVFCIGMVVAMLIGINKCKQWDLDRIVEMRRTRRVIQRITARLREKNFKTIQKARNVRKRAAAQAKENNKNKQEVSPPLYSSHQHQCGTSPPPSYEDALLDDYYFECLPPPSINVTRRRSSAGPSSSHHQRRRSSNNPSQLQRPKRRSSARPMLPPV